MGMFDDLAVDRAIELPGPQPEKREFQTKDLECCLYKYRITADGRLVQIRKRDDSTVHEHDEEYHGMLNFYGYDGNINVNRKWHEYNAKFTDGRLCGVERLPDK